MGDGSRGRATVRLLTYFFLTAAGAYAILAFVLTTRWSSPPPGDMYLYAATGETLALWASYVLRHPLFAVPCAAFIAWAAVEFHGQCELARFVLEAVSWLAQALLLIHLLVFLSGAGNSLWALYASGLLLLVLWVPSVVIASLRSREVRAAMIGQAWRAEAVPRRRKQYPDKRDWSLPSRLPKSVRITIFILLAVAAAWLTFWAWWLAVGEEFPY